MYNDAESKLKGGVKYADKALLFCDIGCSTRGSTERRGAIALLVPRNGPLSAVGAISTSIVRPPVFTLKQKLVVDVDMDIFMNPAALAQVWKLPPSFRLHGIGRYPVGAHARTCSTVSACEEARDVA